ncbi:MAG: acyltransferase family protein [Actinomycetes bacterium]
MSDAQRLIKVDAERLGHIPAFDGLRGLFILIVVGYHAHLNDRLLGSPIVIDWFFVSSGFLITSLLLDERNSTGGISLRNFYARRVLRLFPAMYAMLGVVTLMLLALRIADPGAFDPKALPWLEIVAAATYVYYLFGAFVPGRIGIIGHTWSLTLEEHFYFIWPLILNRTLKRGTRRSDRNLIAGCVVFIAVMVFLRMRLNHMIIFTPQQPGEFIDGCVRRGTEAITCPNSVTWQGVLYRIAAVRPDMIVLGCLTAFVARAIPRPFPERWLRPLALMATVCWVLFFAVMIFAGRLPGFEMFGGPVYQLALFGIAVTTLHVYFRPQSRFVRTVTVKPLRYFGVRTYGIYLWHVPVVLPFLAVLERSYGIQRYVLGLFVTVLGILAGMASFRFIEQPFLRMKESKFRKPEEKTADHAAALAQHQLPALQQYDGTEALPDVDTEDQDS